MRKPTALSPTSGGNLIKDYARTCPWERKCAQSYELEKQECLEGVETVRESFDNGAPAKILHLLSGEIEVIKVDPKNPDDIMNFRAAAAISNGLVSQYKAE